MKFIQVFTTGKFTAEVDGELLKFEVKNGLIHIISREDKSVTEHYFPHHAVSMLRIWEEKE